MASTVFFMQNDTGRLNQFMTEKVFVTYVKARMVCQSTVISSIAYDYNVLRECVCVSHLKQLSQYILLALQKIQF